MGYRLPMSMPLSASQSSELSCGSEMEFVGGGGISEAK